MWLLGSEFWNTNTLYCQNMEIAIASPQTSENCGSPSLPMYSKCNDPTYNQTRQDITNYCLISVRPIKLDYHEHALLFMENELYAQETNWNNTIFGFNYDS